MDAHFLYVCLDVDNVATTVTSSSVAHGTMLLLLLLHKYYHSHVNYNPFGFNLMVVCGWFCVGTSLTCVCIIYIFLHTAMGLIEGSQR